jgi:integrase
MIELDSIQTSIAMLKDVIAGKTYHDVALAHGVTRTAVERRIKFMALTLKREVGIDGINEEGILFVLRLRGSKDAILAALDRYAPHVTKETRSCRTLTDDDICLAVKRVKMRSACPQRDVALLYVLLTTGARPLEVARMEVRDYLNADGCVREESLMRADVALNRKTRPLFFASRKAREAIDNYLTMRLQRNYGIGDSSCYRGLDPHSRLFLTESGTSFKIVRHGAAEQKRFLCRGILDTYRKIFRRSGLKGVTAISLRRTVVARLLERGAAETQIGEALGIGELKSVRKLLPHQLPLLKVLVRDLV